MTSLKNDFELIQKANLNIFSNKKIHTEASEYSGLEYSFEKIKYIQRTAKLTPKKNGQFVTLWIRNKDGVTQPYNSLNSCDFVVIICRDGSNLGRFLFPKEVLVNRGIFSDKLKNIDGKRGFRVYPPWSKPNSKQATMTQKWQTTFFSNDFKI